MTLKEMKIKTFSLIEEYYPQEKKFAEDEDVINKINGVINQIQLDLMKYRKINASLRVEIKENDDKIVDLTKILTNSYQINSICFDEEVLYQMPNDDTLILPKDWYGTFTIYYYKYPRLIETDLSEDNYTKQDEEFTFDLDPVLLEIMPYGIAADLLKMDMISNYGKYFYERYLEMKNNIDPRKTSGQIVIEGGYDV